MAEITLTFRVPDTHCAALARALARTLAPPSPYVAHLTGHDLQLKQGAGALGAVFEQARSWITRYGIWLKALDAPDIPSRPQLGAAPCADAALRAMVASCLARVLPHCSSLASGDGDADALHQARVGLRRLRSALKLFGHWSCSIAPNWPEEFKGLFAMLGPLRDRDVLEAQLLPALRAAHAPFSTLPVLSSQARSVAVALQSKALNRTWVDLLQFCLTPASGPSHRHPRADAKGILGRLQRQVLRDSAKFLHLDDAARHRLRKHLKHWRYGLELSASLFSAKHVSRRLAVLRPAQDALGRYNDLCTAKTLFEHQLRREPRAWFALGWLAAQREREELLASQALGQVIAELDGSSKHRNEKRSK